MVEIDTFPSVDSLPASAEKLFAAAPFQGARAWWASVEAAALRAGSAARYLLCRRGTQARGLFPLLAERGRLGSLTTPYTTEWLPLLHPGLDDDAIAALGAACGEACKDSPVMRWEAIDPDWPALPPLLRGLRRAGFAAARYAHVGNWHETILGLDWAAYLARRPGALRETIRRGMARVARDPSLRFELCRAEAELAPALAAYRHVYARSWKPAEPFPDFDTALLPRAARQGALRLALLWRAGMPVAAQYWIVCDHVATVLKLAHDESHRALSPGTLLTAWTIRRMLDEEGVAVLDFGRGDDPYKRLWAGHRRQRIGIVLARPWRLAGAAALGRQAWAAAARP